MPYPDRHEPYPMPGFPQVCFIKNIINNPNIIIGDYTYYDDPEDVKNFERNVLYHYPFTGDKLIIGKFCAIARGVKFIMNGANHQISGFSTYPFFIFGQDWQRVQPKPADFPYKGDTIVGNDVWLGYEAVIMPGVNIGDGAIVAAKSVVTKDIPPYGIVGGNPAQVLRLRFEPMVIEKLLAIAWWNWEIAKITRNLELIMGADLEALQSC
ncbi:Chloramphenicol O-acetyltransferase [Thalassoporum mexicanum PCC 7367]|uniref:Vat family streptogramin A O-acetyltransferase n=1 Tax=Thalassoporum mexicanum TaxID=3457544 RepID=UPI00029FA1B7|nr:Vat family streptogramin A O-acetyltransferase [Pseudanabaena sp. PCC 7367]AFY70313.1 Chloramphenicol O-acetyltransferase [Pseudanabaena sp. PCC 7367]